MADLTQKINELTRELQTHGQELSAFRNGLDKIESDLKEAGRMKKEFEEKERVLKSQKTKYESDIRRLEQNDKEVRRELDNLKGELERIEKMNKAA